MSVFTSILTSLLDAPAAAAAAVFAGADKEGAAASCLASCLTAAAAAGAADEDAPPPPKTGERNDAEHGALPTPIPSAYSECHNSRPGVD